MNGENRSKINQLMIYWPANTVAVQSWLSAKGVYQQLSSSYVNSNWLVKIGRGAFARAGDKVDWTGGLYAMQQHMKLSIHAGGESALQRQGFAHFLPLVNAPVWLYGSTGDKLPAWFKQYDWGCPICFMATNLFAADSDPRVGITEYPVNNSYVILVAAPERAILEVLYHVRDERSFEHAWLFMQGLTALCPQLLNRLLAASGSVKVNRLFMCLAEKAGYPWLERLDVSRVNFGSGKREIVRGGHLDAKYQITVPRLSIAT